MNLKAKSANNLPELVTTTIKQARSKNLRTVLTTGVFDLLHSEHKNFLLKAKEAGDFLIVAIESDKRVKEIKGEDRPIDSELIRLKNISRIPFVDCAFILADNFGEMGQPRLLIATIRPDILAVSSHSPHLDKKKAILREFGGKMEIVHQHNSRVSTTKILNDSK